MKSLLLALSLLTLSACAQQKAPDLVFGLGIATVDGQIVDVGVLGKARSMEECRQLAAKALAAHPPAPGLQIGCAAVEIQ
jgi:hypothetical protein